MTEPYSAPNSLDDTMNTNQLTATRIKEERLRLNYTQQSVADHLGMNISNYSRLENGKFEITITKLEAIAEFFKVPVMNLIPLSNVNQSNITQSVILVNNNNGSLTQILDLENLEKSLRNVLNNIEQIKKS